MFLTSEGEVKITGRRGLGPLAIYRPYHRFEPGCDLRCIAIATGRHITAMVTHEGQVLCQGLWTHYLERGSHDYVFTGNEYVKTVAAPDEGVSFIQLSCGDRHVVILRSDGRALATGNNDYGQCDVPELVGGETYTQAAAGGDHTVLLSSDGMAIAIGRDWPRGGRSRRGGWADLPPPEHGKWYTHVAAGTDALTGLVQNDDMFVLVRGDEYDVSRLPLDGNTIEKLVIGDAHIVMLTSDGVAKAWRVAHQGNAFRQCDLPALATGLTYMDVSAGPLTTGLLRSDGQAFVCGDNTKEQCSVPALGHGDTFVATSTASPTYVIQLNYTMTQDCAIQAACHDIGGGHLGSWLVQDAQGMAEEVVGTIRVNCGVMTRRLKVVLPDHTVASSRLMWGELT